MLSRRFIAGRPLARALVPAMAAPRRSIVHTPYAPNTPKLSEVQELVDPKDIDDPYMVRRIGGSMDSLR